MPRRDPQTKHPLRCFCSRHPMLAMYGLDADGKLYLHIRVHKQNRVFGDVVFYDGKASIMCRECLRWHNIILRGTTARLQETVKPEVVDERLEVRVDS